MTLYDGVLKSWGVMYLVLMAAVEIRVRAAEALLKGGSDSFYFGPAVESIGKETVFTSPDQWPECPSVDICCFRHTLEGGDRPVGSGEFIQVSQSNLGTYVADFYSYEDGGLKQHGRVGLDVPLIDLDKDGLPDAIQVGLPFEGLVSGAVSWTSGQTPSRSIACRMSRDAIGTLGSYAFDTAFGSEKRRWSGVWGLYIVSGSMVYTKARPNEVELKFRFITPDGVPHSYAGRSKFQIDSEGVLRPMDPDPLILAGIGGESMSISTIELKRQPGSGRFIGTGLFGLPSWIKGAGLPRTAACPEFAWPPMTYSRFKLQLNDSLDGDQDGIPDILAALPPKPLLPAFLSHPEPIYARPGEDVLLRVAVTGENPILLQWYRGEVPVAGANGPVLLLRKVAAKDAGDYRVIAHNAHGSTQSKAARVYVSKPAPEPRITQSLKSLEVKPGAPALFRIVAEGEPELSYQWIKDGHVLTGVQGAELRLNSVVPADIGDYSIIVTNRFGGITSGPVSLVLEGYAPRPSLRGMRLAARGPEIDCNVRVGYRYRLETSVDAVVWTPLSLFTATNSVQTLKHSFATAQPARFYRLVGLSPP